MSIALTLLIGGCASGPLPWAHDPQQSAAECTASCAEHFERCPRIFASFPERGAIECPAEHDNCMKRCEGPRYDAPKNAALPASPAPPAATVAPSAPAAAAAPTPPAAAPMLPPTTQSGTASKEARLRELKTLHEKGLVEDDVYKQRQLAILSEP